MASSSSPVMNAELLVSECRVAFQSGRTRSCEVRVAQLLNLRRMIQENKQAFIDAARADLRKPLFEAVTFEIDFCFNECAYAINQLRQWMKPEKVGLCLVGVAKYCYIQREPLGLVLIIGAWNYPFQLIIHPLIGAIAAGNAVIVKPSEVSPATAKLFEELFPKYLDRSCYRVVNGDASTTTELLAQRFDHILYTGSKQVASIVMTAAAKHLTPVTLELGGKCPLYLDSNCNLDVAVRRATSAKFYNSGQTCNTPDYIICPRSLTERLVATIKRTLTEFFGDNPRTSADYGRMVNQRHFMRVCSLLSDQEIAIGGETDESELYIAPTVLVNVQSSHRVMQEEVFGPIWPIINIDTVDEAIDFINNREKPLAVYVFSNKQAVVDRFRNETSSGAFCGNECFVYGGVETLPFGGVGSSGMGRYHGKFTFDTFSHQKSCMEDPVYSVSELARWLFYAPFTDFKLNVVAWALKKNVQNPFWMTLLMFGGFAIIIAFLYKVFLL